MIISINRIMTALEGRIFSYGLTLCAMFRLIRSVNEFSTGQSNLVLLFGIGNLAILLLMLTALRRQRTLCFIILHVMFLVTTCVTWLPSGGYQGIIPYAIIAMMAFIIFTSHGVLLAATLISYVVVTVYLTQGFKGDPVFNEPLVITQINFLLCIFILISMCVFAKNRFIRYREYIHSVNKRLDTSAAVLNEQAAQLRIHSEQLLKLRKDLEAKIALKHLERDQKKAMLSKYAYVNAHHVRGPLARILGLIALIEHDKMPRDRKRYLDEIKSEALEIDGVVRKISEVLSD
jgi:signal transduction histidine kinase